jgi:uncharacterized membrane protein YphA (DoxX/SURF4 family)
MGLLGILVALGLLVWLACGGWSVLLLAAAIIAAAVSRESLLVHLTQTFMGGTAALATALPRGSHRPRLDVWLLPEMPRA